MGRADFRDPGNLRHQVGLVLAKIWDQVGEGKSPSALLLGLDALAWTYLKEPAYEASRQELAELEAAFKSGKDPMPDVAYRLRQVRIYVDVLRHAGVIDRKPVSVTDETDFLGGGEDAPP